MSTLDQTKQDDRQASLPADERATAPGREDEKRELADDEVGAISGGGNINNPPPVNPPSSLRMGD